jgi:hypothetical protein
MGRGGWSIEPRTRLISQTIDISDTRDIAA